MVVTLQPCLCAAKFFVGGCLLRSAVLKAIKPWCWPQVGLNGGKVMETNRLYQPRFGVVRSEKKLDLEIIDIKSVQDTVDGRNPAPPGMYKTL